GTDDGAIQVTENGGESWEKIDVKDLPGVPKMAFVNDIKADLHDENTVYVAIDNHKYGDFKPYLYKSTNKGKSWKSISTGLGDKNLVWRLVQDHINKDLMFVGTEFGLYFTINGGSQWVKLTGDVPTISFRDLAIQKDENDLVAASFGRGFYILDDYSLLRNVTQESLEKPVQLFPVKKALWYIPRTTLGNQTKASQGHAFYTAKNPAFGAVINYYLKDELMTDESKRQEQEKLDKKANKTLKFPGWDVVEAERLQQKPEIWLTIKDSDGDIVRRIQGSTNKGFNQAVWDLRFPALGAITSSQVNKDNPPKGMLVSPGEYTVSMSRHENGKVTQLDTPQPFLVEQLRKGVLEGSDNDEVVAFRKQLSHLQKQTSASSALLKNAREKTKKLKLALSRSQSMPGKIDEELMQIISALDLLDVEFNGPGSKKQIGEKHHMTINDRLFAAYYGTNFSTYGPTATHIKSFNIAEKQFNAFKSQLDSIIETRLPALEKAIEEANGPIVPSYH
ncbi:MAG: hypothetical protein AB8B80_04635, partial [Marinicellaceae bacterium]